jgi:hypothetical protein
MRRRNAAATTMTDDQGTLNKATSFVDYKDAYSAYENGKQRRYQLLFSVNGGVLAINAIAPQAWRTVLLGAMMIAFTMVMTADIKAFGERFHMTYNDMFGRKGQKVLANIRLILCVSWAGLIAGAFVSQYR